MTGRMNWSRARPKRTFESKFTPGTVLPNGERVPVLPQDDLARRAAREMRLWLKTLQPRDRVKVAQ